MRNWNRDDWTTAGFIAAFFAAIGALFWLGMR
jgi:hypothetical protein